jgi:ectoine hydroxylase-related dioxygenase (phytanoyl-CoA dioxygenase family)
MTLAPAAQTWTPMSADERAQFDRDGFLVIPSVLDLDEVAIARTAILRAREQAARTGGLGATGALHQLSAVTSCPELAFLLDHPVAFKYIWSILGWNIHVYHSHIDVHPQIQEQQKQWWHWHQDGGRQNRELETNPRPRTSVKLAYWLSDVSETGRGNFTVLPGSHLTDWLPGPPSRGVPWPAPEGALQITANPGDLVVFDRRLWHARSDNYSPITRVGAFFGYTYRWIAGRDEVADLPNRPGWHDLNPVQQQLLGHCGDGSGDHAWGHYPNTTPLYGELARQGLLDSSVPALIP